MLDLDSNLRICFYYLPTSKTLEIIPDLPLISWKSIEKNNIHIFRDIFPTTRSFYKKVPNSYSGFIYGLSTPTQFFINNSDDQVTSIINNLIKNIDLKISIDDITYSAFMNNKKSILEEYLLVHSNSVILIDKYIFPKDKYLIRKIDTKISIKKYLEKELYYFKQIRLEGFYYDMNYWIDHINMLLCQDQIN